MGRYARHFRGAALAAVLLFLGCTTGDRVAGPAPEPGQTDNTGDITGITFADERLQTAVRRALGVPAGPLAAAAAETLTQLDATGRGIESLDGIQRLTDLRVLMLGQNRLTEISPLATLTGLTRLDLSENQLTDLDALAPLVQLQDLQLTSNRVCDLRPLSSLTKLRSLLVAGNPIGDLSPILPLAGLRMIEVSESSTAAPSTAAQVAVLRSRGVEVVVKTSVAESILPDTSWQGRLGALISTRLAFVSDMEDGQQDIYLLDARGRYTRLTRNGRPCFRLSWTPDGQRLSYDAPERARDGSRTYQVYMLDAESGAETLLTGPDVWCRGSAWSPDGNRIAVVVFHGQLSELYIMDIRANSLEQLTNLNMLVADPAWSADGCSIYFIVSQGYVGTYTADHVGIYGMPATGGVLRRLTPQLPLPDQWIPAGTYRDLAVSPDGTRLAYVQRENNPAARDQIGVLDLTNGTGFLATQALFLANPKASSHLNSPCWSPDGTHLLFVLEGTLWSELWLVPADGSDTGCRLDPGPEQWPPSHFGSLAWAPRAP